MNLIINKESTIKNDKNHYKREKNIYIPDHLKSDIKSGEVEGI